MELQINQHETTTLLNEAYLAGITTIDVVYPFLGIRLFTINLGDFTMRDVISFDEYADSMTPVNQLIEGEIPTFSDFKQALISSGVMEFVRWDEVKKELLRLITEPKDIHYSRRGTYVSVDTNLLYFRLISRRMRGSHPDRCVHHGHLNPAELRWAISEVVVNEVDRRIRDKYRKEHIEAFKGLKAGYLAEKFMNMSTRTTRSAKSAFLELDQILGPLGAFKIKCSSFPQNKEERDVLIAKTLREFEEARDCDVLLLSADEDMVFHARDNGLSCQVLHVPHVTLDSAVLTPEKCSYLLRDLAVTFGCVSLKNTGVTLFGEWSGMNSSNWVDEDMLLLAEEGARILQPLQASLRISRAMRERMGTED
jgi:hypothetical protein